MAGGGAVSSGNGKAYPGKLTKRVLVTCIVAAMGGLIFGYDLGISGIDNLFLFFLLMFVMFVLDVCNVCGRSNVFFNTYS